MGSAVQSTSKSGQLRNKVTAKKFTKKIDRKKEKGRPPRAFEIGFYLFLSSPQIDVYLEQTL